MKYLKSYNLFENYERPLSEIIMDCEDILLNLNDEGYITKVSYENDNKNIFVTIMKQKSGEREMKWSEIEPYVNRIKEFLSIMGYGQINKPVIQSQRIMNPFDFSTEMKSIIDLFFLKGYKD